jgi:hypothetical protein
MMKYLDMISAKCKEAVDTVKNEFTAKKAKKDLEMKILEIEQKVAEAEQTINSEKSANPVNWEKIGKAIDDKEILERRLKQFKALETEMF